MAHKLHAIIKSWTVEDGEVEVPRPGEHREFGLGIAIDGPPGTAPADEPDGVTSNADSGVAVVVGALRIVEDPAQGRPGAYLVSAGPGIDVVLIGPPPSPQIERVRAAGTLVVEPYLWAEAGLIRTAGGGEPVSADVEDVRPATTGDPPDLLVTFRPR